MMGVDFLPVRRRGGSIAGSAVDESQAAESIGAELSTTAAVAPAARPKPNTASVGPAVGGRAPAAETFLPIAGHALFADAPVDAEVELKPLEKLPTEQVEQWLARTRLRYEQDSPHKKFVTDHHSIVFGEGSPDARLMFVGEAPGAEEDKVGRPFVGRAGQLLDKMITAMGLRRSDVYITNVLKTRPPNNATPTFDEAAACAPYLFEQIAIIRPEVIVTLGLPATRLLLHTTEAMSRLRGRWAAFHIPRNLPHPETHPAASPAGVAVMPTFHPAFLLRSYTAENRQKVWSDLLMVLDRLGMPRPANAVSK